MIEPILLIVEDEAILAMHLKELLSRQGYKVLKPVSTGEEALQSVLTQQPSIILMDIELSGELSGIATAEQISAISDAAVIFLTGFSQDAMLQKAKAAMPYGYLIKPVSERELIATLEMAIYKHHLDVKIKQSEMRYRTLVTQASDGILQADEKGGIIELNAAGMNMLEYTPEEVKQVNFHKLLFFGDDFDLRDNLMNTLREGGQVRCECRLLKKSGDLLPVEISGKILEDGNFQAIFRDISERKAAEKETKQNEIRLRKLVEISHYDARDLQDLLDFTLNAAIELTGSKIGYIYHYDERKKEFALNSWSKAVMKECEVMEPHTLYQLNNTGLWGEAVRQRKAIVDNDFQTASPLKKGYPQGHVALKKYLTIPVFFDHQIVAVVGVANKESDYSEMDILQLTLMMDSVWKIVKRAQDEAALRDSAEQHQTLISTSLDGFLSLDKSGAILKANEAYCQMSGYTADELSSMMLGELEINENTREIAEHIQLIIQQGTDRFESIHRRKDGSHLDVEVNATYMPKNETFMTFFRDITERKRGLEALKESEARFKAVSKYSHNAICLIEESGKINWVNDAFLSLSGYSKHQIYEMPSFSVLIAPESMEFVVQNFYKFVQNEPYEHHYQFTYLRQDGQKRLCEKYMTDYQDQSGKRILAISMLDITERKKSEEELQRWAQIFQNAEWGVVVGSADGKSIEMMNPAFAQMHGYTKEEMKGWSIADVFDPEYRKDILPNIQLAHENGHHTWESRQIHKDGRSFPVFLDVTVVKDVNGKVQYRVVNVQDISQQEKSRKELEEKTREYKFLASAAVILPTYTQADQVFDMIREVLPEIAPNIFAVLMRASSDGSYLQIADIQGVDIALVEKGIKKIGIDLRSKEFEIIDAFKQMLSHTRLFRYPDGFEGFAATEIPKPVARALTKLLSIQEVHVIGISNGRRVYGGLYLFTNGSEQTLNASLIESFMQQCYLALSRIRIQQELIISEERFRNLSENIQETFWLRDYKTGEFLYVSPGFERMWGRSRETLFADPQLYFDSIHAEDRDRVIQAAQNMYQNGKFYNEEFRLVQPDASISWVHARKYPVLDAHGNIYRIAGIAEDISERKLIEQEHRFLEDKFSKAFHTSPDAININRLQDGLFLDVNEGFLTLTGYKIGEVIGKTSLEIDIWVDLKDRQRLVSQLREFGLVENLEADFKIKDGSIITCLMSASLIDVNGERCILSIIRDISERKKIEVALKEREKIFTHSVDMLCMAGFDGYFKVINPAWSNTLGWSEEELLARPWLDFVHPEDQENTRNVKSSIVSGQEVYQFENRYLCKDGSIKWLSWSSFPYPEEGIMFGVARDVTDRKLIEESLRLSENRYRLLFNEMEEGFALHEIICDENGKPVDYRFLEANPAFEAQTGLKREDIIGHTVLEILPGTEPYWIDAYGRVALQDETLHYENYAAELAKWFSVTAFCPRHGYFATTINDVTERKIADELLMNYSMELNVAYDATLQGWANALELREHETAGHSHRVVQQTLWLAQALEVDPEELIHIERGALLHDIGKMGIPDSILLNLVLYRMMNGRLCVSIRNTPIICYPKLIILNLLWISHIPIMRNGMAAATRRN